LNACQRRSRMMGKPELAQDTLVRSSEKGMPIMIKTLDVITEAIRSGKHPFPKVDNRPKKAQKHRYERRKIKEYLHLGEALIEEAV
jgi:hypothetical protein